jgi:small conductance mechanosensitive channel
VTPVLRFLSNTPTTTTTVPAASGGAKNNGIVHHFLVALGVSASTADNVARWATVPLRIGLIVGLTLIASYFIKRLAVRIVRGLRLVSPLVRTTPRGQDRIRTLTGVVAGALRAVLWVIAGLLILNLLDINLAPFVATATIIGAALGFGAQTLVRDFLSGMLILAEDQYGVGDHVVVGPSGQTTTGTVESVTLRVTRLRGLDGVVWYVPNGDIRTVGNDTATDSQALVDIVVPLGTDLTAASEAAESAARQMAVEERWRELIVGPPTFAGVQAVDRLGVTLRIMALTKPAQHFVVAREMRFRILERLRDEGLAWVSTPDVINPAPDPPEDVV